MTEVLTIEVRTEPRFSSARSVASGVRRGMGHLLARRRRRRVPHVLTMEEPKLPWAECLDRVRLARNPYIYSDDMLALEAAETAFVAEWPPLVANSSCDLFLTSGDQRLTGIPEEHMIKLDSVQDLRRLLRDATLDAEGRMGTITGAMCDGGVGVEEMAIRTIQAEVQRCGLSPRHELFLVLEAALRKHVPTAQRGPLVALLHRACIGGGGSGGGGGGDEGSSSSIGRVLRVLAAAGLSSCAAEHDVMTVLVYSGAVSRQALARSWAPAQRPIGEAMSTEGEAAAAKAAASTAAAAKAAGERWPVPSAPLGEALCTRHEDGGGGVGGSDDGGGGGGGGGGGINAGRSAALAMAPAVEEAATPIQVSRSCDWQPALVVPVLHALIGPSRHALVVLDCLVEEGQRAALLRLLRGEGPAGIAPPQPQWQRRTYDYAGVPPTWGMEPSLLRRMETAPPAALLEVQSRLCKLYPEYTIVHMPPLDGLGEAGQPSSPATAAQPHTCTSFVANAAVYGNCFQWHVDADPADLGARASRLPAWLSQHGGYRNGAAGKPLFVSLLVYLDEYWKAEWDAETLFVDPGSGAGLVVQPRPGRAVLMHQDVLHRVSTPSLLARRPRYSLVWKLIFIPKRPDGADDESICRPAEWGTPVRLGGVGAAAGA